MNRARRIAESRRGLACSPRTGSFREVKIIKVLFDPEVKVICGAKRTADGQRDLDWSDGLGRHDGETKMGSTLMVKIGLKSRKS